mgnify:CR=1 FL=1
MLENILLGLFAVFAITLAYGKKFSEESNSKQ